MTRVTHTGLTRGPVTLGGGATIWNPVDDPALAAWYAGDSGTWQNTAGTTPATANGNPVARWSDLSGNGRHQLDGVYTTPPTIAAGYRAGKNCVSFNGTSDMLGVNFARTYPCTLYIALFVPSGTVVGTRYIVNSHGDPDRSALKIENGNTNISAANGSGISIASVTLGAWMYWAIVFNGASSSLTLNNTIQATGNTGTQTQTGLVLGGSPYEFIFGSAVVNTSMIVGELILIQSAHDAGQRTAAYKYLQSRWEA